VTDIEVDGTDMTRQRRREMDEDRFRVNAAREALESQRQRSVGKAGDSGFGRPDPWAEPNKVPTTAPDEDVAATLLLLGCLRDVAEARRAVIFPPDHHYMTPEQRTVLDFLDGGSVGKRSKAPTSNASNQNDDCEDSKGADATLKFDSSADAMLEGGDKTLKLGESDEQSPGKGGERGQELSADGEPLKDGEGSPDSAPAATADPAADPAVDSAADPAVDPVADPAVNSAADPAVDTAADTAVDSADSGAVPVADPAAADPATATEVAPTEGEQATP